MLFQHNSSYNPTPGNHYVYLNCWNGSSYIIVNLCSGTSSIETARVYEERMFWAVSPASTVSSCDDLIDRGGVFLVVLVVFLGIIGGFGAVSLKKKKNNVLGSVPSWVILVFVASVFLVFLASLGTAC